ncbi:hypothetical protein ACJX0J_020424, partial [Zea mays]
RMEEVVLALATGQALTDAMTKQPVKVYKWDMDETLILLKSLLHMKLKWPFMWLCRYMQAKSDAMRTNNVSCIFLMVAKGQGEEVDSELQGQWGKPQWQWHFR